MIIELDTRTKNMDAYAWQEVYDGTKVPAGLRRNPTTEEGGRTHDFPSFVFPEIHPRRYYLEKRGVWGIPKPFVATMADRRWEITIDTRYDAGGCPAGVHVTFRETAAPETPYVYEKPPGGDYSSVFGQPSFTQNPVFPQLNGKSAFLLAVIESGWGDSGNENLFVALDDAGFPCGLSHEFSCC